MKIVIGINTYKEPGQLSLRQELCIKGLQKIKSKDIQIVNLVFGTDSFLYKEFDKTLKLQKSSQDFCLNTHRKYPLVTDIFNTLSKEDCEYFIFLNDDIIVQKQLLEEIKDKNFDCFVASRVDVELLSCKTKYIPVNYNIHGFDLFCIKKQWWDKHKNKFPQMILGKYFWDTAFYVLCKKHGKTKTLNKLPYSIIHPIHSSVSNQDSEEHYYNQKTVPPDIMKAWFYIANNIITNRISQKGINNSVPSNNEEVLCDSFLSRIL